MEKEVIRYAIFEVLRQERPPDQYASLIDATERKLAELHLFPVKGASPSQEQHYLRNVLPREEKDAIREIVWDLIIQRVLTPGYVDDPHSSWPWIRLTEYGRASLKEREFLPHDSEGYLRTLSATISSVDPLILRYMDEALECFRVGCYLATSVMTGAASERVFDLLLEAMGGTFRNTSKRTEFLKDTKSNFVSVRKKAFDNQINRLRGQLPEVVQRSLDTTINSIFSLLKDYRDDSGHPTGRVVARDEAHANLKLFAVYCTNSYILKRALELL